MTKLIKKMVFVLLPVVALAIGFELLARAIPTSYSIKNNDLIKKQQRIEILVLGSSQSDFGIDPKYFGCEAFNISNTSQDLYYDYKVLLKYLQKCKKIKLVIITISYFSLQYDISLSVESWRSAYYSVYMGIHGAVPGSFLKTRNYSAMVLWDGPLGVIKNLRDVRKLDINEYGYQSLGKQKINIREIINNVNGKSRVAFHHKNMDGSLIWNNIAIINKIGEELNKRHIKMVFLTPPVYKTYYENISQTNYNIMAHNIKMLSNKYSAKYYNYFHDDRFGIHDFSDNDHLNDEGAKKFSIIIKNEVIDNLIAPAR